MKALILDVPPSLTFSVLDQFERKNEVFITSFDSVPHAESTTTELINKSFMHFLNINSSSNAATDFNFFSYITTERYTCKEFYDIMTNTGASKYSTAGYEQYLAYKKNNYGIEIDNSKAGAIQVQFGIVEFHIVQADTFFLFFLSDMNHLKAYFNNVVNILVTENVFIPIIRRFEHPFLL